MSSPFDTSRVPSTLLVVVGLAVIVGGMILVLNLDNGGNEAGDIAYLVGGTSADPPETARAALEVSDVVSATVEPVGGDIAFSATMVTGLPDSLEEASIDWHWDVTAASGERWIVSANLNVALNASVLGQDSGHSSTTIDKSMPGSVRREGDKVIVTLDPSAIKGFPTKFSWKLTTEVTIDRDDPDGGRGEDSYPGEGEISYPES